MYPFWKHQLWYKHHLLKPGKTSLKGSVTCSGAHLMGFSQMYATLDQCTLTSMGRKKKKKEKKKHPKLFLRKKKKTLECCANVLKSPNQIEYLMWNAWNIVLVFQMKTGRLKYIPDISCWLHCGKTNVGCHKNLITWPNRCEEITSCSLLLLCMEGLKKKLHVCS